VETKCTKFQDGIGNDMLYDKNKLRARPRSRSEDYDGTELIAKCGEINVWLYDDPVSGWGYLRTSDQFKKQLQR